ncbi:hypothetical protein [Nonomuraea jabiensis]|uniref:Uncharacterized protein n=1 Tax=Nonomuraea jabiensis TaxID=882448 RepID=A0A7W9GDA4_9ACTN|nr:hypothetical protein [Nonomuraea jabiensis]MBB5781712.1 hypothetical protein [Nonomuraea jabiensis]
MAVDIRQYEPIDTVVEVVEVNGHDIEDIVAWINAESKLKGIVGQTALRGRSAEYVEIQTPEGALRAWLGDYIVHDGKGAFWKAARSIFPRMYTPAAAGAVADAAEDEGGEGE